MKILFGLFGLFGVVGGVEHLFSFVPPTQETAAPSGLAPFAVVELFTSEGCSSCPPAEKYLNDLVAHAREQNQKVFPLAFHVDYWNDLGWKDAFSDSRFSGRQREYARRAGSERIYTPQMIVNGAVAFVGSDRQQGEAAIAQALRQPAEIEIELHAGHDLTAKKISVAFAISPARAASVLHLALVERGIRRDIRSGENSGRVLPHDNAVRAFETVKLENLTRGRLDLPIPAPLVIGNSSVIAYVQDHKTNRILGAASVDF